MIALTEAGAIKVKELFKKQKEKGAIGLRVGVRGGGCSGFSYYLEFDNEVNKGDKELDSRGMKLIVDTKSYLYLMGVEIDYVDGLQGKGFKFENPNARRTCGCGESFSV